MRKFRDVSELISNIKNKKEFNKLRTIEQINLIKETLPKKISDNISFGFIKNEVLFFVFTHPALLNEFRLQKQFILKNISILKEYNKINLKIIDIKGFAQKFVQKKSDLFEYKGYNFIYKEKSKGLFKNNFTNPQLYESFEKLRNNIKNIKKENNEK
jgi:hypothetical protein